MRDGNWSEWSFGWARRDSDYPHLSEYIDYVMRGAGDWRAGVVGGVIGGMGGFVGGSIGVLLGALRWPAWTIAVPIALWGIASVAVLSWYFRTRPKQDPAMRAARRQARSTIWRLWHARYAGGIRSAIGVADGDRMERAATLWSETHRMFSISGWRERGPGVYSAAMERALVAMEGAMLKLLALTGGGERTASACESVVDQMEELAREVETITKSRMRTGLADDGSDSSIAAALEHLRQLQTAEDEIDKIHQRY